MRRGVAVVVSLLVATTLLAPAVAAQANETATATPRPASDWTPPGPFERSDLTTGGVHDAEAPPSVRNLGEPISGSVGVRHSPPSPLQTSMNWADPGTNIQSDRIQLYGTAYGDAVGEYELVVVYWNDHTRSTENGTQFQYAANQSVQRVSFNMSAGYNQIPIGLYSHYNDRVQMTMWLERDGERVDGARWTYEHRSNPLTAAPGTDINSKGDLWRWGAMNILLPAIPGIFVGRKAAVHFLDRTVTSARKGTTWWLFILGFLALLLLIAATWQTAAVLSKAPYIAGLSIAVLSFVAMLGIRDQDVEKAEFNQKDLESVTAVSGDESKDAREEEILLRDIVRRDGKVYMPATGIRPFLARYWADAASVDESELETVNNAKGDVSKKYEIDPVADETLHHKPARLEFSPTIVTEPDDDAEPPESTLDKLLSPLGRLNWPFIATAVGGGFIAYHGLLAAFGVPSLAMLGGLLPGVVSGYTARDGELSFEPAPYHFSEARAVLAHERATYREASTFEDLHELVADQDFETIEQINDVIETLRDRFGENIRDSWEIDETQSTTQNQGVGDD
ncbi:hypothetical protein C437_15416 [Haloarcula vallismortis ATCC 29715]|uniref:Uncharacterized protein n=1 Tax=Haloarcula vallismortis ATCC 29715 TaxID=662477 RepID=M0IYK9_HALVA|nr:hypothetical protein [Haloarcula vallismortis]EMA01821.1 hypothetical protein C437_15416 [Haloarcula vallismortis ATCC 29715]